MKYFKITFSFIFLCAFASAQTITVLEEGTGKPVGMATLYNKAMDKSATTDFNGKADISRFIDIDTLYIQHLSYKNKKVALSQLTAKNYTLYLKVNPVTLESFVVSASRWLQPKRDVPQKISVIKPVEVMLENPQTAADLLSLTGEVFMQKSQMGGGSPMIRGFATNRVLITVDNVRMNTAIFRSGNVQNVISLDPFIIENTEVIFGPASVIYGSDAIGGVMNFYTTKPQLSQNDEVFIKINMAGRYASANNENTGHFDVNVGTKTIASLTGFTYSKYGDMRMGSKGPDDYLRNIYASQINGTDTLLTNPDPEVQVSTAYDQYNLTEKIVYKPDEHWEFNYGFHYSETSDYARYDRLIRPKGNGLRSAEWNYGPQKWMMNNLSILNTSQNMFYDQLGINVAWQKFEESRMDRDFNKKIRHIRIENVDAYSLNLDLEKKISEKQRLFYGGEYILNQIHSEGTEYDISDGTSEAGPSRYPDGALWKSAAAYLNYIHKTSEQFVVQTGIRYNNYIIDATFDTTFYPFPFTDVLINNGSYTGSLGFVYNPHPTWRLAINVSSGFRSPNVDDMGKVFDSSPGSVIVPNKDLKAEYSYNIDFDIAKRISDYVKVDVIAFYTLLDNALVRRDFTLNGFDSIMYDGSMSKVQAVQNASVAYVKGIQAGLDITTPFGLGLVSKLNLIKGEEELDDGSKAPLRHAPPIYGTTKLTFTYNKLKLNLYAIYNGEVSFENLCPDQRSIDYVYAKDSNGNPYTPAFTTYNFKAMYQINNNLNASAGIENITDVRYKPYASGMAAPGRNFIVSLRASF